jgi:hypothetical protein
MLYSLVPKLRLYIRRYYYLALFWTISLLSETALAQETERAIFRTDRINALILVLVFSTVVIIYTRWARQGKTLFLRKIPGLEAVEEAVGRATVSQNNDSTPQHITDVRPVVLTIHDFTRPVHIRLFTL